MSIILEFTSAVCGVVLPLLGGIPEPSLFIFGSVTNATGDIVPTYDSLFWRITIDLASITDPATVASVNGRLFYFVHVPFEAASFGSIAIGHATNTFALTVESSTYTRSAWLSTNACSFVNPAQATFNFSKADRGKVERVDLAVSNPKPEPPLDTDGDGFADWVETLAGTDPNDRLSFPLLSAEIRPAGAGLMIEWASTPGATYAITAATNLATGFQFPPVNVTATGDRTSYHDPTAIGSAPFFYRIKPALNSPPMKSPVLNLQIARTYLAAADPGIAKRTWQEPMDAMGKPKPEPPAFAVIGP